MAKEVTGFIKLQIKGGAANPAPPVGPALGSKGLNIMDFCKAFNAATQGMAGKIVPVVITVYSDKSYSFEVKQPPVTVSLKEAAKITKASGEPNRKKYGSHRNRRISSGPLKTTRSYEQVDKKSESSIREVRFS